MNTTPKDQFAFRHFAIQQDQCAMKVGIDAVTLGAWVPMETAPRRILDIGTGTGILALMMAQRFPSTKITAVEIDELAAAQAAQNVANSPFSDRIKVIAGSVQTVAGLEEKQFDLIVCNPPFFTGGVLSEQLSRATARHTVKLSHRDLLASVRKYLSAEGTFALVLPKIEALRFRELAAGIELYPAEVMTLRPRADKPVHRLFQCFQRGEGTVTEIELSQYQEGDIWTIAFKELVGPYYQEAYLR